MTNAQAPHIPTGIEAELCTEIARRQALGIAKYGTTVADNPLTLRQWLQHLLEEQLDAAVYTRRAIAEIDKELVDQPFPADPVAVPAAGTITVGVQQIHPDVGPPTYATDGSGCFDLYAMKDANAVENERRGNWQNSSFPPGTTAVFNTGLAFEIPDGHAMLIFSRSGHGFNSDVSLSNGVGVIDADYRGEVKVKLRNDGTTNFRVMRGDRIAQALVLPVPAVRFVVKDHLSRTMRGGRGFGSTGA